MTQPQWRYLAWGLDVIVPFPVPDLSEHNASGKPDLVLHIGSPPADSAAVRFVLPSGARVAIAGQDAFVEIEQPARPHPSLLRSLLAVVLRRQGRVVLHAAAVRFEGRTIALAGATESGKSTLAAAICLEGGRLITDEMCAMAIDGPAAIVLPGTRILALRPDGYVMAGHSSLRSLAPERWRNDRVLVPVASVAEPLPLDALYLLEQAGASGVSVTRASGASLAGALIAARFQPDVGPPAEAARELEALGRLGTSGAVFHLRRAANARPADVIRTIRAHDLSQFVTE